MQLVWTLIVFNISLIWHVKARPRAKHDKNAHKCSSKVDLIFT